jgi:hypothetical protein
MTHPITPPPELVQLWVNLMPLGSINAFTAAAQWGADQELDACCEWLQVRINEGWNPCHLEDLRAARRPKQPSLKEQAMRVLVENGTNLDGRMELDSTDIETIRRALEQLDD